MRLIARARGPLRERQPDGVARVSVAARLSFVYCGARQISRCFSRRDCDGRDRYGGRRATLVSGLRGRRFSVCALCEASDASGRAPESAAGAAGIRLIPDPADTGCALNVNMYTYLQNYTTLGGGRDKSGLSVPEPAERVRARPRTGGAVGDGRE